MPKDRNTRPAIVAATLRGHDPRRAAESLASFPGIGRRLQCLGSWNDVLYFDDYAHHPTELEATLSACRDAYPKRRLVVIFQPHRFSRTRDLAGEFGAPLAKAVSRCTPRETGTLAAT